MKEKHQNRQIKMSLRIKIAMTAIFILCSACCLAGLFVVLSFYFLYHEPITIAVAVVMCLIVCAFTMIIGGIVLWHGAQFVTNPIIKISKGVQKVADGDFSVQLSLKKRSRKAKKGFYTDEIDELVNNFNKMTRELHGMDYMRKDFMSNVSHEIKTPVAAITGFSEILLDGGLEESEQKEYLTYLNQESLRLSRLCENMLHMSRLDNQSIVDKQQEVAVDEQLRRCIIMLGEKWSDKNINFELKLEKCSILSNYDLLYQIWTNLIDNAIKYSRKESSIWITTEIKKDYLKVIIRDEGVGISAKKQSKIYNKFYQCEESHKKLGSGLGLSIVLRIVELLQGTISCDSEEGKGTAMTVRLPVKVD